MYSNFDYIKMVPQCFFQSVLDYFFYFCMIIRNDKNLYKKKMLKNY